MEKDDRSNFIVCSMNIYVFVSVYCLKWSFHMHILDV